MTRPHRSQYRTEPPGSLSERVYNVITDMSDAKSVLQELQAIVPSGPKFPLQPIIVAAQEEPGMFDSFEAYPWFLMVHRYDAPAPRPSCSLNSTSGSSAPQRPSFWSFGRRRFITAQPARGEGLGIAPENVGSRFLSLLQSAFLQTFSAISGTRKSPTAAGIRALGLGVRKRNVTANCSPNANLSSELGLGRFTLQAFSAGISEG